MPQTAPLQQSFRLADHVRACLVDGQVILLDLRRDRYIGVGGALLATLATRIVDWPSADLATPSSTSDNAVETWLDTMRRQGMLDSTSTVAPHRPALPMAQHSLATLEEPLQQGLQWRRIASVTTATLTVGHWLKHLCLAEIALRIEHLRTTRAAVSAANPQDGLQSAARWYLRMRPLVMSSHDECLRDSLILLCFLCAEGFHPRWVIGVRTRPFGAHSWVQEGTLVLNDLHETVRGYTPILTV